MAFDLYNDVTLTRNIEDHGLRAGDVGTVVELGTTPRPWCCQRRLFSRIFRHDGNAVLPSLPSGKCPACADSSGSPRGPALSA
jgi:hypothetical protein